MQLRLSAILLAAVLPVFARTQTFYDTSSTESVA